MMVNSAQKNNLLDTLNPSYLAPDQKSYNEWDFT